MTRLVVVRHGETAWNVSGRLQGVTDEPLNARGREQAARAARAIVSHVRPPATVVASPLSRARDTAVPIAAALGAQPHTDARLIERTYGVWEGLTWDERVALDPVEAQRWRDRKEPRIDGYENHTTVASRMLAAVDAWLPRAGDGDVVFVTHGSSGRMLLLALLGMPLDSVALGPLGNAAWSVLGRAREGSWTLERHNVDAADDA